MRRKYAVFTKVRTSAVNNKFRNIFSIDEILYRHNLKIYYAFLANFNLISCSVTLETSLTVDS